MNLQKLQPRAALNKAFLKINPFRNDVENFKNHLQNLLDKITESESEEFHKNLIVDFFKNTFYSANHFINTKGRNDLVIYNGKDAKSSVGVILEFKKPNNKGEMLKVDHLNTKAFQELVLYFLRERLTGKNLEIKYLIATNIYEWFIFDAQTFENLFIGNKSLVKQFTDFEAGRLTSKKTEFFYKEIAQPAITEITDKITFTHFDIREYQEYLNPGKHPDEHKLISLFKLFSPEHLLKLPFTNDSNTLDKGFYSELLHIIGLVETKEGGKKLIQRKKQHDRNIGSLIENAISQIDSLDKISRLEKPEQFGETYQEQLFNLGLELAITWMNRILFLKLLEAQLIRYHKNDPSWGFLNLQKVANYDDLNSLFFSVLARKPQERSQNLQQKLQERFAHVPYLNSSLFEPTDIEQETICISNLRNEKLPIFPGTILKDNNGKKLTGEINTLEYLFAFLNAYNFSSDIGEEIQEENKRLINASVLGLIFEKINGYKDGSFFTPGFITMYMCRETIRRAVIQKFNDLKGWNCETIDDLYDQIEDKKAANDIINSLKICDPAVGSGHFLVSALNEIIAIKSELKILLDRQGKRLKEYSFEVANDELVVTDEDGLLFEYNPKNQESQRVQETLFHEKQTIIENCLFGVDINPNSVKICRLRLWIELLKNAYYKTSPLTPLLGGEGNMRELETLPNIDINIKCGNSLISRFSLDGNLQVALSKQKYTIEDYKNAVKTYRNAENKEQKRKMERLIQEIKGNFKTSLGLSDPNKTKLRKLEGEVENLETQTFLIPETKAEKTKREKKIAKLNNEIDKLRVEIEDIENGKIYENALEWRFEFPEVLNDEGVFVGFDVVIGNPPYGVQLNKIEKAILNQIYEFNTTETAILFIKKGWDLLHQHGYQSYIIPKSYTFASNYEKIRQFTVNNLISLVDCGKVWPDVKLEVCIFILTKISETPTYSSHKVTAANCEVIFQGYLDKDLVKRFNFLPHGLSIEEINIGLKLLATCQTLNDISINQRGAMIQNLISDEGDRDVIGGAEVQKYGIEGIKGKIYLENVNENKAFIHQNSLLVQNIIAHIENPHDHIKITAAIPKRNDYILADTINQIKLNRNFSPELIWSILHSNLINWYVYRFIFAKAIRTMHFDNTTTSRIPIPKVISVDIQEILSGLNPVYDETYSFFYDENSSFQDGWGIVDKILNAKKSDPNADTTALEAEIDQMVYQLYNLTPEEIQIIESSQ
ncbi:MAG: Eco57I restriction-modification methylase domain-containing protein [Dolichospermum sp.]|jgi:adenine-specific DNA-methyltransferase